jgi:hypothetical protein
MHNTSAQELKAAFSELLDQAKGEKYLAELDKAKDPATKMNTWVIILKDINANYWDILTTTNSYPELRAKEAKRLKLIQILSCCVQELTDLETSRTCLIDKDFPEQIALLHLVIANNFYWYPSDHPLYLANCKDHLGKAGAIIMAHNLFNTLVHVLWHYLEGCHALETSVRMVPGTLLEPREIRLRISASNHLLEECIDKLQNAFSISVNKLHTDLNTDIKFRRILFALAHAWVYKATQNLLNGKVITQEIKDNCINAKALLDKLSGAALLREDGTPDTYLINGCNEVRQQLDILSGYKAAARTFASSYMYQLPKKDQELADLSRIVLLNSGKLDLTAVQPNTTFLRRYADYFGLKINTATASQVARVGL